MCEMHEERNPMTTITIDRAVVEQALHVAESAGYPVALIKALRAALAQQAEPVQETCTYKCEAWPECGCAPPKAEPVEPVAWLAPDGSVRETPAAKSFGEWVWGPDDFKPLYTAPPQRKPLTEEEIDKIFKHLCNTVGASCKTMARAVERAHGIKE